MADARAKVAPNPTRKDVAAIHVLKAQLKLTDDDYRALLQHLVGEISCTSMSPPQLLKVRLHFEGLARKTGVGRGGGHKLSAVAFQKAKAAATPKERKVWALWHQLGRDGLIEDTSPKALNAWIHRQVGVDVLSFCSPPQLDTLIESLKQWVERRG